MQHIYSTTLAVLFVQTAVVPQCRLNPSLCSPQVVNSFVSCTHTKSYMHKLPYHIVSLRDETKSLSVEKERMVMMWIAYMVSAATRPPGDLI